MFGRAIKRTRLPSSPHPRPQQQQQQGCSSFQCVRSQPLPSRSRHSFTSPSPPSMTIERSVHRRTALASDESSSSPLPASALLSPKRIKGHVYVSPIEHLALSHEYTSECHSDFALLKTLRTDRSATTIGIVVDDERPPLRLAGNNSVLGPSASAIQTSSEALFFPSVVHDLLPMIDLLPSSGYELLLLLARFYNSTEAKDTRSEVGRQMAILLERVQRHTEAEEGLEVGGGGSSSGNSICGSKAFAQVRFIANAALISDEHDSRANALEQEVARHRDLIPLGILETLLTVAVPRLCRFFLVHTLDRIGVRSVQKMGTASTVGNGVGYDAAYVFTLWSALLANDHFFNPLYFADMHACLMLLVARAPIGPIKGPMGTSPHAGLVPVLNKASRVYSLSLQGRRMMELHSAFFSQRREALRLMPWAYFTRLIGGVYDDISAAHELAPNGITAVEEAAAWDEHIMPIAKRFLGFFSNDEKAVTTLWKITFKAAMLFPSAHLSHARAAATYALFIDCGVPQDMNKDQFAQLIRLYTEMLSAGEGPCGEGYSLTDEASLTKWKDQLRVLGHVLSSTPSVSMHWGMNALDSLLGALCVCPTRKEKPSAVDAANVEESKETNAPRTHLSSIVGLSAAAKQELGAQLLSWLTVDFFVAKKVASTNPLNVSTIRKSAEELGVVEPSPFWWECGCKALNSSHSDVCGKCMRNDRARWRCSNPSCLAPQRASGGGVGGGANSSTVCSQCGTVHPMVQAAERADVPMCDQCVVTPLNEDLLCTRCDEAAVSPTAAASHTCTGGPRISLSAMRKGSVSAASDALPPPPGTFHCGSCGHTHTSRVVCPKCGVKTNPSEPLGMWLCGDCGTYSYLFNKKCARCASAGLSSGKGSIAGSERSTNSFRISYQPWLCGCGKTNPMARLGCGWCGQSRAYTCPSCDRPSTFEGGNNGGNGAGARMRVSTPVVRDLSLPLSLCQHCGDVHPRDATVLENSSALMNCYNCGGQCTVGAESCLHCGSAIEGLNPFLPFWCESCERGSKEAQTGFDCQYCKSPRSEISDCSFLWRCVPRAASGEWGEGDEESGSASTSCTHWNPSWLGACEYCGQSRVYDGEHETRARHCGRWQCEACESINEPSQVLICGHCDDGLHVPPPCKQCGRAHAAFACPTEDLLANAADILEDLQCEVLI